MSRAIVEHINERVETVLQAWDWPEWQLTEERAYRQIWDSTRQYKRVSDKDGKPDEVFYLGAVADTEAPTVPTALIVIEP